MLLAMGASLFVPGLASAQEVDDPEFEAKLKEWETLNGYSSSSEVLEMSLGAEDAPVPIHEFASFTCPHCANFHANQFQKLKADYIDTGKVRFIFRDVYLDRPGLWASMLARCSGPDHFFDTAALLFHNQGVWAVANNDNMMGYFSQIGDMNGMSPADLEACYVNRKLGENLVAWSDRERSAAQVTSTPTLLINGKKYPNMSYEDLAEIIEKLL
jgi:protein-disulfide isomerase